MRTCLLQTHSNVNEELYQLTLPNHAAYAGRHGYDMIQLNRSYKEVWWGIEDILLDFIEHYDRILTVGSDVIFTDIDKPLDFFDDGEHSVFVQEEGLGSDNLNFDLVLWSGRSGVQEVIHRLRQARARYETHPWGLQWGMTLLSREEHMKQLIRVYPPRHMQSAPYTHGTATWQLGDFALHFVGMSNRAKVEGCSRFLHRRELVLRDHVGYNDGGQ